MVPFPDTHALIDPADMDMDGHPLVNPLVLDPFTCADNDSDHEPLIGSAGRGYFPSVTASERSISTAFAASSSSSSSVTLSAIPGPGRAIPGCPSASESLTLNAGRGGLHALAEKAALGVVGEGEDGEDVEEGEGEGEREGQAAARARVVDGPPEVQVHAGYQLHSAPHMHSVHAAIALAEDGSAGAGSGAMGGDTARR